MGRARALPFTHRTNRAPDMNQITLEALASFPANLQKYYDEVPANLKHWAPPSWTGIPSEPFTAIEQICHVRDIEIDGYHVRFKRALNELNPQLESLDGASLAIERDYGNSDSKDVFSAFRAARAQTVRLLSGLREDELSRRAIFSDYGDVTVRSLAHYLCSHDQQHLAGIQWLLGQMNARY
jgi:hypothetical protein